MTAHADYRLWQDVHHVSSSVGVLYVKLKGAGGKRIFPAIRRFNEWRKFNERRGFWKKMPFLDTIM
jgi:hypothetical protein